MVESLASGFLPRPRSCRGAPLEILGGGAAGAVAALATVGLAGCEPRAPATPGATTVMISVADLLLYVSRLRRAVVEIPPIAVLRALLLSAVLAWMCAIARSERRGEGPWTTTEGDAKLAGLAGPSSTRTPRDEGSESPERPRDLGLLPATARLPRARRRVVAAAQEERFTRIR